MLASVCLLLLALHFHDNHHKHDLNKQFDHNHNSAHNNLNKHYLRTSQWLGSGNSVWWYVTLYLCLEQRTNNL